MKNHGCLYDANGISRDLTPEEAREAVLDHARNQVRRWEDITASIPVSNAKKRRWAQGNLLRALWTLSALKAQDAESQEPRTKKTHD